jgi:hypothetical protein
MRLVPVIFRPQNLESGERGAQNGLDPAADGVFRLEMAGVDEIEAAVFGLFKMVVFEIGRHEGVAPGAEHIVHFAAAGAAPDRDQADGSAPVGPAQARTAELFPDEGRKVRQRRERHGARAQKAVGPALLVRPRGVQHAHVPQAQQLRQAVVDAARRAVEIGVQIDGRDAVFNEERADSGP